MATTDITRQRLADRAEAEIQTASAADHRKSTLIAVTAVLVGLLAAVMYAAVTGIGDWSQLVVLGGIALATIGTMIAIDPLRKDS